MKEPTKEEIKEFWEKCGFKQKSYRKPACEHIPRCKYWVDPKGNHCVLPEDIDLNNLFKYALDSVKSITFTETKWTDGTVWTQCHLRIEFEEIYGEKVAGRMKDVAHLALYKALEEVIK